MIKVFLHIFISSSYSLLFLLPPSSSPPSSSLFSSSSFLILPLLLLLLLLLPSSSLLLLLLHPSPSYSSPPPSSFLLLPPPPPLFEEYLLDLWEGYVQPQNQGRYTVGCGAKHRQLKEKEALQMELEMLEKQRLVVNLVTLVPQVMEMAKSTVKREREMAESKTFVPPGQRQNVYRSITEDDL